MKGFWILAAAMISLALAFVLVPLLKRRASGTLDTEAAELAVYRKRLSELKDDLTRGILTEAQFEDARQELEAALAVELTLPPRALAGTHAGLRWTMAAAVAVAVPVLAFALYEFLGARQEVASYLAAREEAQQKAETLRQSLERLEARLATRPDDGKGWWLMGRFYLALGEYAKAVGALSRAQTLLPEDPELLLDYAQALAGTQGDQAQGAPARLIERALALAPEHPRGLWLGAVAALQRGARAEARAYLERLLSLVEPGSEAAELVRAHLAELQEIDNASTSEDTAITSPARIEVRVSLDPKLAVNALPTDPVFIFARAVQGPPMPLAVVRKQVKDLPLTVVLDDSQAMMPERRLSRSAEVVVGARISRSGDPRPQSGDLEGSAQGPIALATARKDPVNIIINQVVP